jgi:hypothetical protein
MMTVRHIQKRWQAQQYRKLMDELLSPRIEALAADGLAPFTTLAAAALALIRLDEMDQSHAPICPGLIRAILTQQQADGGWGDVCISALCLRALSLNNGAGHAILNGMGYLAMLQQPGGIWPKVPLRRMPGDALISAFALLQLGDNEKFRAAVQFDAAVYWFEMNEPMLDDSAQILWRHARIRTTPAVAGMPASWS